MLKHRDAETYRPSVFGVGIMAFMFLACWVLFLPHETHAEDGLIARVESQYNNIFISKSGTRYSMLFGANRNFYTESIYNSADPMELPVVYTRYMTIGLAYNPDAKNLVEIGSGGGRTVQYLHDSVSNLELTTVELDPKVIELSKQYFGLKESNRLKIANRDGRIYLRRHDTKWDIIMVDAYRGPFVPFHLLTREFYQIISDRMQPGGVLVQNVEPTTMVFDAALATINSVFKNVELFKANGNIVLIAYHGEAKTQTELQKSAEALQNKHNLRYDLREMVKERLLVTATPDQKALITDDFAPVEYLQSIKSNSKNIDQITKPAE